MKQTEVMGIVTRNTGSWYEVEPLGSGEVAPQGFAGGTLRCKVKGNFRIKGLRTTSPVAVGDVVRVSLSDSSESGFITAVEPRRNYMIRRASNLSKESHILAANIDLTLLVATLRNPDTSTTFIDRFLATAEAYSIPAILVLNKADTWDDSDRELADALHNLYTCVGYEVVFTSARTGLGLDRLREILHNKVTLLAPCFPAYLAPTTANRMEGMMLTVIKVVDIDISPIIIPPSIVLIMDWLATCCAILSEAPDTI